MSGAVATYTQDQHLALVGDAVARETTALAAEKAALADRIVTLESEKAASAVELAAALVRVDVVEAEKVNAEKAADTIRAELDAFRSEIQRAAQIQDRKAECTARVKAANANLGEDFYSDERVTRWAQQSVEDFESFVADITDAVATSGVAEQARQTAAFTGGQSPIAPATGKSSLASFLGARRANPA